MPNLLADTNETELRAMFSAWRSLRNRWRLDAREIAALLPEGGFERPAPSRDTEVRMRILVEIGYRLPEAIPTDEIPFWLRSPHPALDWLTPLEEMSAGLPRLRRFRALLDEGRLS